MISALMIVFMLFDAGVKILKLPAAVEGTVRLGYPVVLIWAGLHLRGERLRTLIPLNGQ